jgi:hypothetical protein
VTASLNDPLTLSLTGVLATGRIVNKGGGSSSPALAAASTFAANAGAWVLAERRADPHRAPRCFSRDSSSARAASKDAR